MIASELQDSLRRAMSLYRSVTTAGPAANLDHGKIAGLLSETFGMVKRELDSLKDADPEPEMHEDSSPQKEDHKEKLEPSASRGPRQLGDDKTLALRQQYLELLLQAVEKRMDKKL
ncbi:mitogen-activated protein kinase-binding protein 1-like [Anomaloglossus baeobatrachus]|uniref:mitogen-activated protein kinase-binding protein 1-like n=1 Tax=Anomaloglossus baeobatrachus TaxID=238106 RepID=UPI003F509B78